MGTHKILIRAMATADVPRVSEIEAYVSPDPWSEKLFADCLSLIHYHCVVAVYQSEVIGFGLLSCAAGEAHILNLAILPSMQQQGFGKQLLQYLIGEAKKQKAETLLLEVRYSNQKAQHLYTKSGFSEIGTRKDYYKLTKETREDALVFALGLDTPHG